LVVGHIHSRLVGRRQVFQPLYMHWVIQQGGELCP
jgi:hypothetical protein